MEQPAPHHPPTHSPTHPPTHLTCLPQPAAPLPRLVLKRAGPAGEGQPELPLTAGKLEAFLHHVYGVSTVQVRSSAGVLSRWAGPPGDVCAEPK